MSCYLLGGKQMINKSMLKIFPLLVLLLLFIQVMPNISFAQSDPKPIKVSINGELQVYDQPPVIEGGRTLVPLRGIFETLEAQVNWDGATKKVTAVKQSKKVILQIGSNIAVINGKENELDVPAQILNGRTMVPLRFVSETLGAEVLWDGTTRTIFITPKTVSTTTNQQSQNEKNSVTLMPDVTILDQQTTEKVMNIDSDGSTLTFFGEPSKIISLQQDDIFILPPVKGYPVSLARKVVTTSSEDGNTIIQTTTPEFSEVFETIDMQYSIPLTSDDFIDMKLVNNHANSSKQVLKIASTGEWKVPSAVIQVAQDTISIHMQNIKYTSPDGKGLTTDLEVDLKKPALTIDFKYDKLKIKRAHVELQVEDIQAKMDIVGSTKVDLLDKTFLLMKPKFKPIIIEGIPLPVGTLTELNGQLTGGGQLEVDMTSVIQASFQAGVLKEGDQDFESINKHNNIDGNIRFTKAKGKPSLGFAVKPAVSIAYFKGFNLKKPNGLDLDPLLGYENPLGINMEAEASVITEGESCLKIDGNLFISGHLTSISGNLSLYSGKPYVKTFYDSCTGAVMSVDPSNVQLQIGKSKQLNVYVEYKSGSISDITKGSTGTTYTSSNENGVMVDQNGLLVVSQDAQPGEIVTITIKNDKKTTAVEVTILDSSIEKESPETIPTDESPTNSSTTITSITAFGDHSIVHKSDGTAWAWGGGLNFPFGDREDMTLPIQTDDLFEQINLSVILDWDAYDPWSKFIVKEDGTVWGWGTNAFSSGLLPGDGYDEPAQVQGLTNVDSMDSGYEHAASVKQDGTVWAWGNNRFGQLGDGTSTFFEDDYVIYNPVQVKGLSNVAQVAVGSSFRSSALKEDGTVWVWGPYGSIGYDTDFSKFKPIQVTGLSEVTKIDVGWGSPIALKSDGTVWTWDDTQETPIAVQIDGIASVKNISSGGNFNVALKTDGTVWSWGENDDGELGNGSNEPSSVPTQVTGLSHVTAIDTGISFVVALRSDGTVWAWGNNDDGELGNGTFEDQPTPVKVKGLE
jgi:alpha-tubulin suppressor-like RCC1 family protein